MKRFARYRNNAELMAAVAGMGHIRGRVLDATYGYGSWWGETPDHELIGADIAMHKVPTGGVRHDFRRPPFRSGSFDTILHDADYKLNGTPNGDVGGPDERYGAHVVKTWRERLRDLLDGVAWWPDCECGGERVSAISGYRCPSCTGSARGLAGPMAGLAPLLAPGGSLLIKSMIQVSSGAVRHQPFEVMKRAEQAGLVFVDEFQYEVHVRPQPEGRRHLHAESNFSTLTVVKARGRRRT